MRIMLTAFLAIMVACGASFAVTARQRRQTVAPVIYQPAAPPQAQENTIIAIVQNVVTLQQSVTVLDTWGKATVFPLRNARIYIADDGFEAFATITDLRIGQRVQITYAGSPDHPTVIKVIILPKFVPPC